MSVKKEESRCFYHCGSKGFCKYERGCGRFITRKDEGGGSGRKFEIEDWEKDVSPRETARILNRDVDRECAVAETKIWGESLRKKRRQSEQGTSESNDTGYGK